MVTDGSKCVDYKFRYAAAVTVVVVSDHHECTLVTVPKCHSPSSPLDQGLDSSLVPVTNKMKLVFWPSTHGLGHRVYSYVTELTGCIMDKVSNEWYESIKKVF